MSMSDPIADLLTRIRNAQMVSKPTVTVPSSKVKAAIVQVLKDEGYIDSFTMTAIIAFIEEGFGITVPQSEVTLENFDTVDNMAAFIQRQGG